MRRLLLVPLLAALMGADGCESIDHHSIDHLSVAARSLGPDAICTWKDSDRSNWEIICISRGVRYACLVGPGERVSCAATSTPVPAEAR